MSLPPGVGVHIVDVRLGENGRREVLVELQPVDCRFWIPVSSDYESALEVSEDPQVWEIIAGQLQHWYMYSQGQQRLLDVSSPNQAEFL